MIYFTADLHFCHESVINLSNRPFANREEMNTALIHNWNSVVGKLDEVYILGDFCFRGSVENAVEILGRLKGKKYLIEGNHDKKYVKDASFTACFEWVKDYHLMSYEDARLILFHYPILEWAHYHRKSAHLYGHVHNNASHITTNAPINEVLGERAINVGVDCNYYYPVSVKEVYARAFANWEEQ